MKYGVIIPLIILALILIIAVVVIAMSGKPKIEDKKDKDKKPKVCKEDQVLINGECKSIGKCENSNDCGDNQVCIDGKCTDCQSGYVKKNGVCVEAKCPDDYKCKDGTYCNNGSCVTIPDGYEIVDGKLTQIPCPRYKCDDDEVCENGKCVKCKPGYYIKDGKCVLKTCDVDSSICTGNETCIDDKCVQCEGKIIDGKCINSCPTVPCKNNEVCIEGRCVKCKDNEEVKNGRCVEKDVKCGPGYYKKNNACFKIPNCNDDEELVKEGDTYRCIKKKESKCPEGQELKDNKCVPKIIKCNSNEILKDGECIRCEGNKVAENNKCRDPICGKEIQPDKNQYCKGDELITCPSGTKVNSTKDGCVVLNCVDDPDEVICNNNLNYICDKTLKKCVACPEGKKAKGNECVVIERKLVPNDCTNTEYLDEKINKCIACPDDFISNNTKSKCVYDPRKCNNYDQMYTESGCITKKGMKIKDGKWIPKVCPDDFTCVDGTYCNNGVCDPCNEESYKSGSCPIPKCGSNQYFNLKSGRCEVIPEGYFVQDNKLIKNTCTNGKIQCDDKNYCKDDKCTVIPNGYKKVNYNAIELITSSDCNEGEILKDGKCVKCDTGIPNKDRNKCIVDPRTCKWDQKYEENGCVTNPGHKYVDGKWVPKTCPDEIKCGKYQKCINGRCVNCIDDDFNKGVCTRDKCDDSRYFNTKTYSCETIPPDYIKIGEKIVKKNCANSKDITCNPGEYCNNSTCTKIPDGYKKKSFDSITKLEFGKDYYTKIGYGIKNNKIVKCPEGTYHNDLTGKCSTVKATKNVKVDGKEYIAQDGNLLICPTNTYAGDEVCEEKDPSKRGPDELTVKPYEYFVNGYPTIKRRDK